MNFKMMPILTLILMSNTNVLGQILEIEIKVMEGKLNEFRNDITPISKFKVVSFEEHYLIETESVDPSYRFENVQYDSIKGTLTFKQYDFNNNSQESISYSFHKLDKKKAKVKIIGTDEKLKGNAYRILRCTNQDHQPRHSCSQLELKTCVKENGCEF